MKNSTTIYKMGKMNLVLTNGKELPAFMCNGRGMMLSEVGFSKVEKSKKEIRDKVKIYPSFDENDDYFCW